MLQNINSPEDLKKIPSKKIPLLAEEIRKKIIHTVAHNGGHLASNLGAVELTLALHRVFNSPEDAIIFDVSHQSYTHKLVTGRYKDFDSLRKKDGMSGFTRINESEHDYFDAGHASSSISSALGLLTAWKLEGRDDKVVAVIGDGALTGGMAFEALSHAGQISPNLIVVLNDNQMSISKNTGSISRYLSRLTTSKTYQSINYKFSRLVDKIPYFSEKLAKFNFRMKRGLKGLFLTNNLFVDLGFEYVGPLNGHNVEQLEDTFRRIKNIPRPVVVHVITQKGKGYSPAENDPSSFHGVGPFNISDGVVEKFDTLSFTESFSRMLYEEGLNNPKIAAITAAMAKGTGLDLFARHFPDRFFDVGIAEEHAVTFAGGLSAGGMIPVCAIYSTFIQRSVDQMIMDLALQNRHAVLVFDRAGAVPGDGETHQGIFDIALLRPVPNFIMLSPATSLDQKILFKYAVYDCDSPVSIRWPKSSCPNESESFSKPVEIGRGLLIKSSEYASGVHERLEEDFEVKPELPRKKVLLVTTGGMYSECVTAGRSLLLSGIFTDIYSLRFLKPLDEEYFNSICKDYDCVVFVEDGVYNGGVSQYLRSFISNKNCVIAFPDKFSSNGNRQQILEEAGITSSNIIKCAQELLNEK